MSCVALRLFKTKKWELHSTLYDSFKSFLQIFSQRQSHNSLQGHQRLKNNTRRYSDLITKFDKIRNYPRTLVINSCNSQDKLNRFQNTNLLHSVWFALGLLVNPLHGASALQFSASPGSVLIVFPGHMTQDIPLLKCPALQTERE